MEWLTAVALPVGGILGGLVGAWWSRRSSKTAEIGTLLNALAIGPSADLVLWLVPTPDGLLARIGLFVAGLLLLALATAF